MAYPTTPTPAVPITIDRRFSVLVSEFDSGAEQRRLLLRFPKRKMELNYRAISRTDRNSLSDHFNQVYGSYTAFNVFDWSSRHWEDEYMGYGDGSDTTFDVHGKDITSTSLIIYKDSVVSSTTTYAIGTTGTDGAACVTFTSAVSSGCLLTHEFDGKLRMKARYGKDFSFREETLYRGRFNVVITLEEVQW